MAGAAQDITRRIVWRQLITNGANAIGALRLHDLEPQ
jgi:hypothetical protein